MHKPQCEIKGVIIKPLKKIPDERGTIMHGVRSDNMLNDFGEVYFKKLYKDVINGWHVHETLILNYICIYKMIKVVLYDMRKDSPTKGTIQEVFMGDDNYVLLHIPPGIANASTVISGDFAIFCNVASETHDPNIKYKRIDPLTSEIPYDWSRRNY
jgi:dTDP-4-dehydrorhamnose 3,5-epimerase